MMTDTVTVYGAANNDDCLRRLTGDSWALGNAGSNWRTVGSYNGSYSKYGAGFRFLGITIPKNAIIVSAYFKVYGAAVQSSTGVKSYISVEAADNAAAIANNASTFDARYATHGNQIAWDDIPTWASGTQYISPDIGTLIQAIVNRSGWTSGNSILLFWEDFAGRTATDTERDRSCHAYYEGAGTKASLVINYTIPNAYVKIFTEVLGVKDKKISILSIPGDITPDGITVSVNRRENKINDAVMTANDDESKTYLNNLHIGDIVKMEFTYLDTMDAYTEVFEGMVVNLEPSLSAEGGAVCKAQLYAFPAIALNRMRVTGQYSLTPWNLQTLRDILVSGVIDQSDFPYTEYFTESVDVINEWESGDNIVKVSGGEVGSCYIKMRGLNGYSPNYRFPKNMASGHGFPLFIDSFSNPIYDPETYTWSGIPKLDLWIKRDTKCHNIEIQLRATTEDYVRFQLTDQDRGSQFLIPNCGNIDLLCGDSDWHHIVIPVGSRWAEAEITVDDISTVQPSMTGNGIIVGQDLRHYCGWDFQHNNNEGEHQNWEGIADITFFLTTMNTGNTYVSVDGIKFTGLSNPHGIITDYVNKAFALSDSGYGINMDCIGISPQLVPYLKFIYEPVTKCLQNMMDLITGYNWAVNGGAGMHWTMIGNKLCIASLDDHSVHGRNLYLQGTVTQGTHNLILTAEDASTLFVGETVSIGDDYHSETNTILQIHASTPSSGYTTIECTAGFAYAYGKPFNAFLSFAIDQVWPLASKYVFNKPLAVGDDIIFTQFRRAEPEANFVIVNGVYQNPPANAWMQGIAITEVDDHPNGEQGYAVVGKDTYAAMWTFFELLAAGYSGETNDRFRATSNCVDGPQALYTGVHGVGIGSPTTHAFAQLVLINEVNINLIQDPHISFWINTKALQTVELRIFTELQSGAEDFSVYGQENGGAGDYFWMQFPEAVKYPGIAFLGTDGPTGWIKIDVPIGPNAAGWNVTNHATWSKTIKAIQFKFVGGSVDGWVYFDSLNINGQTIRVAKSSSAISVQGGIRTKLINEILVGGYSQGYDPDDKVGTLDPLDYIAIHELMREIGPLVNGIREIGYTTGSVTVPFDPDLMGGQHVWIQSPSFGAAVEYALDADVTNGESVVHVSTYSGLRVGQSVTISDANNTETKTIYSFSIEGAGYYIHFSTPLVHDYLMSDNAKITGTMGIKLFRILYVTDIYNAQQGALTKLQLTDDLTNSVAKDFTDLASQAIKAVNPDFQNRDYIRLKMLGMDWRTPIAKIVDLDS